ncbi:MAG: DUF222 domain-containing protein [Myxococcota bacterium]
MSIDDQSVPAEAVRAMSDAELEQAVAVLSTQIDEAEHRLLTLVREMDRRERHRQHGLPTMAAWLGWRVGLGPVAAREKVRVAKALGELPAIDAALARGEVSYSKVRAMTRIATPANESKLLYMAKEATAAQLETICRGVEQVTGTSEDGIERWVRSRPDRDGMVRIEARLHADEAALVMKAIELARDGVGGAGDSAEALVQVAESYVAGQRHEARPGGERHQLLVCVKADLLAPESASAELSPTGAQVPSETLRRMACDASVTAVSVDDEGTPLDVGRKTRTIPPAIRRALHVRDGGCRFPGCANRRWLDAHHIEHWVDGGRTSRDNLLLLCSEHHRLVHEGGFRIERRGAELAFLRPDGERIAAPRVAFAALAQTVVAPRPPSSDPPDYSMAVGILARAA